MLPDTELVGVALANALGGVASVFVAGAAVLAAVACVIGAGPLIRG